MMMMMIMMEVSKRGRERARVEKGGVRGVLKRVVPGELGLPLLQDLNDVGLP